MKTYHWVYGLCLSSELAISSAVGECAAPGGVADVAVVRGRVSPPPSDATRLARWCAVWPGCVQLQIRDVGDVAISSEEIVVDLRPGVPDDAVLPYLVGSGFGAMLHLRGLVPLHASALVVDGTAVAFTGASGAGKSTTAHLLVRADRPMLSDDVCALEIVDGEVVAVPGFPRIKLNPDVLPGEFDRTADGSADAVGKHRVTPAAFAADPAPLTRVFVLRPTSTDPPQVHSIIDPSRRLVLLARNVFRPRFAGPLGQSESQLATLSVLAQQAEVALVHRPPTWDPAHLLG